MKKIIAYLGLTCVLVVSLSGCMVSSLVYDIIYEPSKPKVRTIHLPDAIVGKPYSEQISMSDDRKDILNDMFFHHSLELYPDNLGLKCIKCMPFLPNSGVDYRLYIDDINAGRGKYGNDGFSGWKVTINGTPTAKGTITIEVNIHTSYTPIRFLNSVYLHYKTIYKINIIDAKEPKKIEQDNED